LSSFLRPAHGKPLLVLPLWTTLLWRVVVVVVMIQILAQAQAAAVLVDLELEHLLL
jgi:hypothetical protein